MIRFPNAKVNLTLRVGNKRKDGFHEIQSIFYPIPFHDILEIIPSGRLKFQNTGLQIEGNPANNLCLKAYDLLKQEFDLPPVSIHIHKLIPMGAGLGGGSSDASETLIILNKLFDLELRPGDLAIRAQKIGSDCPYFLLNKPALVQGRGEIIKEIDFKLKEPFLVLVDPGIHIPTAHAYNQLSRNETGNDLEELDLTDLGPPVFQNDFQASAESEHPELIMVREFLLEKGASYAGMTGSGASYFGLFNSKPKIGTELPPNMKVRTLELR